MILALEAAAAVSVLLVASLVYLVLFERGGVYRASEAVHALGDDEKVQLLSRLLAAPVSALQSFEALKEGDDLYERQLEAIRAAGRSIHLEAYSFYPGRIADALLAALCERAGRGVRVRVVIDSIGSLSARPHRFAELIAAGGQVQRYHPLHLHLFRRWNSRTHRNLLVVDGEVAFIGGAGVADHWSRFVDAPWRDCALRVSGPIVAGLQAVFAENWLESSGEMLTGADAFPASSSSVGPADSAAFGLAVGSTPTAGGSTRARVLVQLLLAMASHSIDLCTPYFIPDPGFRRELLAARTRGVRGRILTGGAHSDHRLVQRAGRRRYGPLLEAGVEIFEYAPRMMHAGAPRSPPLMRTRAGASAAATRHTSSAAARTATGTSRRVRDNRARSK